MSDPRSILTVVILACVLSGFIPVAAGAYATVAPPPAASPSSGLPDGRVYELASPFNKHGYQAGANARAFGVKVEFSMASPNGNAVAFRSSGPAADTNSSGLSQNFVAERTSHGWTSRSATARGLGQNEETSIFIQDTGWTDYSPDLSHLAYAVASSDVSEAPARGTANYYLMGTNPLERPTWLLQSVAGPTLEEKHGDTELVGMSPDANIVYLADEERLLPQDVSRTGWGIYESRNGAVTEAGVLPDGSIPSSGAMPMATDNPTNNGRRQGESNPASLDNQLSDDGTRLFFVSSGQLYVHTIEPDGSEHSVLVSASQLPGHQGEAAPDGVIQFENLTKQAGGFNESMKSRPTYGYASPDGSHVFFQSQDRLTSSAPSGTGPKTYDFNVDSGTIEYLPSVSLGGIVTAAKDGSSFVFESGTSSPPDLDMWTAGSGGGSVIQIAQLPGGGYVGPGRMTDRGSAVVFQAQAPIAGFNNAESEQVYRYDVKTNELGCISCPPVGISPSKESSYLSAIDQYGDVSYSIVADKVVNDARGTSSDGAQIFFASPDALVDRDTNGDFDTYEWENGKIFLISSGKGADYSVFLDNSESGGDIFFATSDELVQGDNDAAFDVYDARVPHPGDNPPPSAVPCSGDVCQGPPSVAQLLGAPPSATFTGAGNLVDKQSAVEPKNIRTTLTRATKLANALSSCRKRKAGHKRILCERRARKRYPAAMVTAKHDGRRGK